MIDVVRKTCNADEKTEFKFRSTSIAFLVKNFTSAPVTVCFKAWDENQSVMVGAGIAETIVANPDPTDMMKRGATSTVIVSAEQSGIVEVIRND